MKLTSDALKQFQQQFHSLAIQGQRFADDLHSIVDAPNHGPLMGGRQMPLALKRATILGIIASGAAVSTLGKLCRCRMFTPRPRGHDHVRRNHLSIPDCCAAYEIEAEGRDGQVHPFEKPWFMVLLMFLGEP